MSADPLSIFGLRLPAGITIGPLLSAPAGPFWQALPGPAAADYADGLEELIADYNQQAPAQLAAWAQQHPLTSEQRFILEYNTSADRANVLRTLPLAATERVLEVGCGCGPVSQYLWSRARTLSLEASAARARAAAYRLAGQANPHGSALLCGDFHQLDGAAGFDWVIFNGVLEYAAIYSGAQDASPYVAMLKKAFALLKPGGRCVVTIENQLGLKYFAGAPEDHYDRPAVGLEGYRRLGGPRAPIRTFSRPALARIVAEAGFGETTFQFPFPDYKFTKVLVPDETAAWQFAAERLIEPSPAWRAPREYHLDEPAVFRALAAEGLAGNFAHSFLLVAGKPGPGGPPAAPGLHYFPLKRDPASSVGATFDLVKGEVRRRLLNGGAAMTLPVLPPAAPANPQARFAAPRAGAHGAETIQPISPEPSLWESLRGHLGAVTDAPADYENQLTATLRSHYDRYVGGLPLANAGSWPAFVAKLRAEFAHSGLTGQVAGILRFLEQQQPFAEQSLARLKLKPWSLSAPDWIMENLFPAPDGAGLSLFDVEYVDPAASLPTPVLVFRQLRVLQNKVTGDALRRLWPWPALSLQLDRSTVELPAPVAGWMAETLWENPTDEATARHVWFWSKVVEVVECAMTATVVAPFTRAYETTPWLEKLATELGRLDQADLASLAISRPPPLSAAPLPADQSGNSDAFIVKEQQIRQLADEVHLLRATAASRLEVIQRLDLDLRRALAQLGNNPAQPTPDLTALADEIGSLRLQLDEARGLLQSRQVQLRKLEREAAGRLAAEESPSVWSRWLARWEAQLAERTLYPLAKLQQYPARPLRPEKFPRPAARASWPRICIITPSYQQAPYLEATMRSVLDQDYPNLAYGVQDGGSTDGSAEIIMGHVPHLAHAESAPDQGQSDAIRRGLARLYPRDNDLMAWLNSDDLLMPGALHYVGEYFARHPEVDVIYGHRVIIDEAGRETGRWFLPPHSAHTLPWFDLVPQETLFWRARCLDQVGGLDPDFHFALDWDLLLRFEQAALTIRRVPYFLGCFRIHPQQKTSAHISTVGEQEMQRLRRRTHGRDVPGAEIQKHLDREIRRSARVEWLHRHGVRW